jgi:monoamine oxidase
MKFAAPPALGQSAGPLVNHSDTMPTLNRRSFLAASAAVLAKPAVVLAADTDVDVVIIGAGAAGIAAARRVAAAKVRYALVEAASQVGGRCVTDTKTFGVPFDRGAHWIHNSDVSPLAKLATGLDIYAAPRGQTVRVGPRNARDSELENFLVGLVRSRRAIIDAGRGKADIAAERALPKDLGDWRSTIEFVLGPYTCGKALSQVSAMDFARLPDRDSDGFCRQGYGTLLAQLADGLTVQLDTPAKRIAYGKGVGVLTPKGSIFARAGILTASTDLIASGKIEFAPALDRRALNALSNLKLGSYDHIALELPGNPLGLQRDDVVFEKSDKARTAALLANVSGTDLHLVTVAGDFGRELSAQGEAAMVDFAREWLASLFGPGVRGQIKRSAATRWNEEPFVLGGFSAAAPGQDDARRVLMEPLSGKLWFAGEAVHQTHWGTVQGAWDSGVRAAESALRRIGALKEPAQEKSVPQRQRPSRRHRGR